MQTLRAREIAQQEMSATAQSIATRESGSDSK
jgi:hypothetical protein